MRDLSSDFLAFAATISAVQLCGETPGEPYPWLEDTNERCLGLCDHVLYGLDHISGNGTVW